MRDLEFLTHLQARDLHVVVDNEQTEAAVRQLGFQQVALTARFDFAANTEAVLWLISDYTSQYGMEPLWDTAGGTVVQMTQSKAGGGIDPLRYTLETLLTIDYAALLAQRDAAYEQLLSYDQINIQTPGASLHCHISEEVEIASYEKELESGYLYSLTEFLKASILNLEAPTSTFSLVGEITIDGLLYQANYQELWQQSLPLMQEMRDLSRQGNNRLQIENNAITGLVLGGKDMTGELVELCDGREWQTNVTELALGLLDINPDYAFNTLLHQSNNGVHIGMGMGEQIPFLDFWAKKPNLHFPN
ncbi:MAG: Unknown protein [uncultured Thiotrichaceae bacterium]|uniref:Crocagin biosynthetic protein CgnE/B domain-containing protein n=1 Tax=uncultured Thiotrichaceae bacterium TaxID=298394 RepID=A0A6S6U322_9GAMM|nr:MAG: Unknown protein [uncultured Thiotrichaceae bacterium]